MFGWEYPPAHLGGLGVACQGIVRGLLHHGATVTLVLPHTEAVESGVTILSSQDPASKILSVPTHLQPYDSFATYASRETDANDDGAHQLYGANLGEEVQRFTDLAVQMTKNIQPDIVHTHDWMTLEAGVRASKYHRKPLVAHVHATELDRTEFNPNPWIFKREILGLRKADHIIAVSGYTRGLLMREYGISSDKITVLHNGTFDALPDERSFRSSRKHPLVLFLGRLTVQKGATHFIEAARKIADIDDSVRFVVAGEGYLLPELIAQACKAGLQDRIMFAGRVTTKEAKKLYTKADCFVMPSVSEPFGLVALEAITHGAPVVLSKHSGASVVVHNSLQVDFWDTDKMADCILTVLREEPLRKEMRTQTPRILTNITWPRQGKKVLAIYDGVLDALANGKWQMAN